MSTAQVRQLQPYRERRERRYEFALALHGADPERALLLPDLRSAISVAGGDRAAAVWVDEYGAGLVHAHVVLDLASDRPRRAFALEPLRLAWCAGVPGVFDVPYWPRDPWARRPAPRSLVAVALGSDGLRTWFMVVDGQTPRCALSVEDLGLVEFLAGRVSAVLLHKDMGPLQPVLVAPEGGSDRFAAWPILMDIEGREGADEANRRISRRFLVARVVRAVVVDDLSPDAESLAHQVSAVRREVAGAFADDPERVHWEAVLSAVDRGGDLATPRAVLDWAQLLEEAGELSGARELYRTAFQLSTAVGAGEEAFRSAYGLGRCCRRAGERDSALGWHRAALALARSLGARYREVLVLRALTAPEGETGGSPGRARLVRAALGAALASHDSYASGALYQELSGLAADRGDTDEAIRSAWTAVQSYQHETDRCRALIALAETLGRAGEAGAAEDACLAAGARARRPEDRLSTMAAFALLAALRGDRAEFERRSRTMDHQVFAGFPTAAKIEAMVARGLGYEALGDGKTARRRYRKALRILRRHRVRPLPTSAERARRAVAEGSSLAAGVLRPPSPSLEMVEIREGLARMRETGPG